MARSNGQAEAAQVILAVGLGRGFGGKSTGLAELVWRARNAGREVIVADGDPRSRTLAGLFPEAMQPPTEELPDVKAWLTGVLNRMVKERRSAVLDLGGGDRVLQEYGRDLRLVEFCARRGIEPLALYFLGPEDEDLRHVLSIWDAAARAEAPRGAGFLAQVAELNDLAGLRRHCERNAYDHAGRRACALPPVWIGGTR